MPFASIYVRWCGPPCRAVLFDVAWADGTRGTLHYGTLPIGLTPTQFDQLRRANERGESRKALAG